MEALLQLAAAVPDFARQTDLEFIGEVHPQFRDYVMNSPVLKDITRFTGNIPHQALLKLYGSSSLLVLILNGYRDAAGYMPGKMFEYLATGIPVLGVGPVDGDAALVLKQSAGGEMIAGTDIAGIRNNVLQHFEAWRTAQPFVKGSAAHNYSRKAITARLAGLLSLR
jgi:glycosyltransferase involved in cell wall biosynthesis